MFNIDTINENNSSQSVNFDKLPDECPNCHKKITPSLHIAFLNTKAYDHKALQIIFRCPNENCKNAFIGFYSGDGYNFYFELSKPYDFIQREFSEITKAVSPDFVMIYNQAYAAEQSGLTVICGAGYRKALEFLIKDYLISKNSEDTEKIKKEFLGTTIEKRVTHPQIKVVAKRAVWLGNDETHYERKWQDKDIADLKDLIDLTLHWIEADKLTEKLLQEMPDEK
jgi:hypothetical protein